ncbi:MAG TPA: electron transfer flavoprotein subunit beta/FixA family protein [Nitrososphaerales archaeon]|nr:electron transfer flavoprotein subunit beta/FixA family protein [Nitrososphaerales archaeon]
MRIAVCVKQAVDETELKVGPNGVPLIAGAASKVSTFDKNAVEEALRLKSAGGGEVVIFTVGPPDARKAMKEVLAMGADRGVHVVADTEKYDSMLVAQILAKAIQKSGPYDLTLCSEGSSDTYSGQVPPMLAEFLGQPYAGYARKVEVSGASSKVERALEDKVEVVECPLPFVASVVNEINEPRYPTLIQIMQASKKPVEEATPEALGVSVQHPLVRVESMSAQPTNRKRVLIEGTPEEAAAKLIEALAKEGVIPG